MFRARWRETGLNSQDVPETISRSMVYPLAAFDLRHGILEESND